MFFVCFEVYFPLYYLSSCKQAAAANGRESERFHGPKETIVDLHTRNSGPKPKIVNHLSPFE
jgi:hypothetical protein